MPTKHDDKILAALETIMQRQSGLEQIITRMQQDMQHLSKEIVEIKRNQATFYGRMLVTRKNLIEIYEGRRPSITHNEAKELSESAHPPLFTHDDFKKKSH